VARRPLFPTGNSHLFFFYKSPVPVVVMSLLTTSAGRAVLNMAWGGMRRRGMEVAMLDNARELE
jgi:hypothetical protein